MQNINEIFGNIDIYLFDQIQKGKFSNEMKKILDAGCGGGRNLIYFMREGYNVFAIDQNPEAIEQIKYLSKSLKTYFRMKIFNPRQSNKYLSPTNYFDWVISNAVLHFAENKDQFDQMLTEMWRALKPNGILFARLASSIGIENIIIPTENGSTICPTDRSVFLWTNTF